MNSRPNESKGSVDIDMRMDMHDRYVLRKLLEESSRGRVSKTGDSVRQEMEKELQSDLSAWSGID